MTTRRKRLLLIVAEIVLLSIAVLALRAYLLRDAIDGPAPSMGGSGISGAVSSLEDLRGRPVLVHFWATWCPVCALQKDTIQALSQDWAVLTVALDSESPEAIGRYMRKHGLDFPVLLDTDGALARAYRVAGVPYSFVLDPQGEIRFVERGYTTELGLRLRLWLASL